MDHTLVRGEIKTPKHFVLSETRAPEHFLCDSSLKDNQMQADQLQLIREEKHSNNNSKYRRILPKESHPCVLQSSEKTIRQQPKATATSTSYPHEKISQFTRYSKISYKVLS